MHASSTNRRGFGALVALVLFVLFISMVYAVMTGTSGSGALTGVVRVAGQRMVALAAQSALAEASFVLRHPPDGGSRALSAMHDGANAGDAHDPAGTRELYRDDVEAGRLEIGPVRYEVVTRAPVDKPDVWMIDLTVRVKYKMAGSPITRQLRRRLLGRICHVTETLGPERGKVVLTSLAVQGDPLFEVIEP